MATPGWNLATRSPAERLAVAADRIACHIRHQCQGLKGAERQRKGRELLGQVSGEMNALVVEALKGRAGDADRNRAGA